METPPAVMGSYAENVPLEVIDDFRGVVAEGRLDLRFESRPPAGPQAGLEWLLPTDIGVRSLFFIVRDEHKSPSFPNHRAAVRLRSAAGQFKGAGACGVVGQPWK